MSGIHLVQSIINDTWHGYSHSGLGAIKVVAMPLMRVQGYWNLKFEAGKTLLYFINVKHAIKINLIAFVF